MGEIARNLIATCAAREDSFHNLEMATIAVWQLAKMLKKLRKDYQARLARRDRSGQRVRDHMNALTPQHVLTDLFGSGDFPAEIIDPEHAAEIVIQRLNDAGFKIESAAT
jgi:hypothetical protein